MKEPLQILLAFLFISVAAISCKEKKETVRVIEKEKTTSTKEKGNYLKIDEEGKVEMKIESK